MLVPLHREGEKGENMNKQHRQDMSFCLICTLLGAILVTLLVLRNNPSMTPTTALSLCGVGCLVYLTSASIIFVFSYYIGKIFAKIDKSAIEEYCWLIALRISDKRRSKNADIILPRLRYFLFTVLKKNNEFLSLPLGEDELCLNMDGVAFRQNNVYYRFSLILPEDLEQNTETFRLLIQSYVEQELSTYGCYGLRSVYVSNKYGTWWSVYIDQMEVDEKRHRLIFELMYINNNSAALYRKRIFDREHVVRVQEQAVYDDTIE